MQRLRSARHRFQDDLAHKLDALRSHCADVGRDYTEIEKTTVSIIDVGDDREQGLRRLVDHLGELAARGIDHAIVGPRHPWDDETLAALASIVPEVHSIPTVSATV